MSSFSYAPSACWVRYLSVTFVLSASLFLFFIIFYCIPLLFPDCCIQYFPLVLSSFAYGFQCLFLKSTVFDCVGYIPVFLHMMLWCHLEFVLVCLCPLYFYSGVVLHLILICSKGTTEIPSLCLGLLIFLYWFSISLLQLVLYCIKSSNIIFSTSI